jgi:hypothetical protein
VILEGAIDSIFIENAVGCTGLKVPDDRINKFPYRYYLLDNDEPGRIKSVELLCMGEWVFMWKKFLSSQMFPNYHSTEKTDINDLVVKAKISVPIKFETIKPFFTNNVMDKMKFTFVTKFTERRYYEVESSKKH